MAPTTNMADQVAIPASASRTKGEDVRRRECTTDHQFHHHHLEQRVSLIALAS